MLAYKCTKCNNYFVNEEEKLKKIVTIAVLAGFMTVNFAPAFAVEDIVRASATPKHFKSLVKKKKKATDEYKYAYINMDWWKNFNDENLNNYIVKAVQNNYDLKMATLAVEEYYQATRAQFANELPTINAGFSPNLVKMPGATHTDGIFAVPAFVNYEVDIFLKNRDKTRSVK